MTQSITYDEIYQAAAGFMARHTDTQARAWPDLGRDLTLEREENGHSDSLLFSCRTNASMANGLGVVHGGITAALVDTCMGIACAARHGGKPTPTITLTTNYARPVPLNADLQVRTHTVRVGATSGQLWSEVFPAGQPDEVLVTATGVFHLSK